MVLEITGLKVRRSFKVNSWSNEVQERFTKDDVLYFPGDGNLGHYIRHDPILYRRCVVCLVVNDRSDLY